MTTQNNIQSLIPLNKVVKQAILDTYGDYSKEEARFTAWAVRGIKKLTNEILRSGKRQTILNINKNLNTAVLPCDFKEELFVGIIDDCGNKIPLNINSAIVDIQNVDEIPCENECDKGCDCYPKQLCADLQTTQVINKIKLGDSEYDETVTSTLQPNGEYYQVTTTPYVDIDEGGIVYVTKKEFVTKFDVANCGCIEKTERNAAKLENSCYDQYCCYCTGCNTGNTDFGGYKIFIESGIIKFDKNMPYKKAYLEYRGSLPKSGNEYLVPEVSFETLVELTKYMSVKNKKGVAQSMIAMWFENYMRERGNMTKILGRMKLADIIHSALTVPTFDYNTRFCSPYENPYASQNENTDVVSTIYVDAPSGTPGSSTGCNPSIITTNGAEMAGGTKYNNSSLIGVPFRVFANPFNRYLKETEYNVLPTGGFEILTGVYGVDDEFDIFPKWCSNSVTPDEPVIIPVSILSVDTIELGEDGTYMLGAGYMVDKISIKPTVADTVKIGLTDGGDEIMVDKVMVPDVYGYNGVNTPEIYADGGAVTIYFTGFTAPATIKIFKREI